MPAPSPSPVSVFDHADYRSFLSAYYLERKSRDRSFSHRYLSRQVGTGSAGWFSDIVKGRTNLSDGHMAILLRVMGLDKVEAEYFESLVRYDQATSLEEKSRQYRRLLGLKGVKAELVGADRFEFYSAWHHAVIRELLFIRPFDGDYAALGRRLVPPIGAREARRSIQLLEKLGFVRRSPSGSYVSVDVPLKKDPAFKAVHLGQFLKANCVLGTESLDRFPKEERDISAMTLPLSAESFRKAREEIRALRERLLALSQVDGQPEKVYQCNFHIFPVTE